MGRGGLEMFLALGASIPTRVFEEALDALVRRGHERQPVAPPLRFEKARNLLMCSREYDVALVASPARFV